MSAQHTPLFSRSQNSCPFGKCTADVKSLVPEDVKEKISALAVINHQSASEYIRDLLLEHIYGHVSIMQARAGKGMPGTGRE